MTTRAPNRRCSEGPVRSEPPPAALPEEEPAMYESNQFEELDEYVSVDHPMICGCRECDPDFYFDPAERDAGRPDPERWNPED
jgi:hypothetical protein